jgi:hypothetical protein
MDFKDFITFLVLDFIKPAIWLIMSLAVAYFLWSIAQVIIKGSEVDQREELKKRAVWGIVALFVMTSMWGLVNILVNTFRPSTQLNQLPLLPTGSSGGSFGGGTRSVSGGTTAPASGSLFAPAPTPQQTVVPNSGNTNPLFQPTPTYPYTPIP